MNIYDIAAKSGVSPATVSRVINGSAPVRAETREKVMQVIRDTDFQPNAFAQGLNFNSIGMVGILCSDFGDTFYSRAVAGLERYFRAGNMNVTLVCSGYTVEGMKEGIRSLKAKNVDAIVLLGAAFEEVGQDYISDVARVTPVVTVSSNLFDDPNICAVFCDERTATKEAVGELLKAGCSRILYVGEHRRNSNNIKLEGYADAYAAAGLVSPELVLTTGDSSPKAETVIYDYLAEHADEIDAVMAGNDSLAAYSLKVMHRLGIMRPVIGFNNSAITGMVMPELSSVDNMLDDMCKIAVERVNGILNKKKVPQKTALVARLVRRESF